MSENNTTPYENPYVMIPVLPRTRKRIQTYLYQVQNKTYHRVTYDSGINELLDLAGIPDEKEEEAINA